MKQILSNRARRRDDYRRRALTRLGAETPRVFFIEPKDGAVVANPFTVKFGLEGLALKPAGDATPDSGHHHLIIDGVRSRKAN